jgi:GT2 family glycosyltransferase
MIQPESIAVVLPVHSRKQMTLACLHSLSRQSVSGFKVIVVDSGSTDGTADAVEAEFPNAIVLRHGNLWWTRSTNEGVKRALADHAKYILTINDDLEFADNYLESMMRAAETHPLAIMGSYAFDFDTRQPIYCGERMNWITARARMLLDSVPPADRHGLLSVSYFSARGLWLPAEVFSRVGLFDAEHLPHYIADQELTARAAGVGFEVYVNCDAVLFNHDAPSGRIEISTQYSWKNYRKHLFGIQGGGNLKNFTIFAFRHCPRKYLPLFWGFGIARRLGGYLRDWAFSKVTRPLPAR